VTSGWTLIVNGTLNSVVQCHLDNGSLTCNPKNEGRSSTTSDHPLIGSGCSSGTKNISVQVEHDEITAKFVRSLNISDCDLLASDKVGS